LPNLLCGNLNGRRKPNDNHRRQRNDHSARTPTDLVSLAGHDFLRSMAFIFTPNGSGVDRDYTANPNYHIVMSVFGT
jgi:hypothetical protein